MTNTHFDAIIIGSGTSAYYCARGLLDAGKRIAIIDERPFGGTCALRGCQPKKYLVANAEAISSVRHLLGRGIVGNPSTDWSALQELKNAFLDGKSEAEEREWQQDGVVTIRSRATIAGENAVTVNGDECLTGEHIVMATGASPRRADITGKEFIHTSDDFLELAKLPERILFIGGGYISFEFAHVAACAGSEVTILHRSERPLRGFDPNMVDILCEASKAAGIRIELNTEPVTVMEGEGGLDVSSTTGKSYQCDLIIEATGRLPNLSALDGGQGNVASSTRGVTVNDFLQSTTNPHFYAIGDCADSGLQLATVADHQGKIAATNIVEGNTTPINYGAVPSAAFTIPSIASVGLSEDQAKQRGLDFRINRGSTMGWPSSKRIGEGHGGFKVIIDNGTERILGAHLVRHNAAEVINTFALAIQFSIPAPELTKFLWAYPTSTSDLKYMVG